MKIKGLAIKFGDDVNTDVILPGKYLVLTDPRELAKHAMEGIDPDFHRKASRGVILVAGKNFGCGSSREHAPIALKYAGVKAVVADSFARIFFRNSINIGLPAIELEGISKEVDGGDMLEIDLNASTLRNLSKSKVYRIKEYPKMVKDLLYSGGLVEYLRRRLSVVDE